MEKEKNPPVEKIRQGNVVTKIFANTTTYGIQFKIEPVVEWKKGCFTHAFTYSESKDAIRGMRLACKWIRKHRGWLGRFLGV